MMDSDLRSEKAVAYFKKGYNCAQSVVLAYGDLLEMEEETLAKLASSFGGGMGRLREVCGSVSGMFMAYGMLKGYSQPEDTEGKKKQYKTVQEMASAFSKCHGSIICRDILKKQAGPDDFIPDERTETYYISRPCEKCVADAAKILENFLRK